ncbi:MAG: hypothetical protein U0900_12545 [Myxococcota bacterium]
MPGISMLDSTCQRFPGSAAEAADAPHRTSTTAIARIGIPLLEMWNARNIDRGAGVPESPRAAPRTREARPVLHRTPSRQSERSECAEGRHRAATRLGQPDPQRIVVRRPTSIGGEERKGGGLRLEARLAGIRDGVVVVEGGRLVGVDVPLRRSRDPGRERGAREGMVEASDLPVEDVAVGRGAGEPADEIDAVVGGARDVVGTVLDRANRIFAGVAVEVSDDQEVGIPARRGIAREPVDEGPGACGARRVAVSLAVTDVGVPGPAAGRALRLQMDGGEGEGLAGRDLAQRLGEDGPIARVEKAGVDAAVEDPRRTDRLDAGRSI